MSVDFKIVIESRDATRNLQNINNAVDQTTSKFSDLRKTLNSITDSLKSTAVGLGIGLGIKELGSSIIQLRGQFQQVEVSMTTMLNSATKAQELIEQMKRTAIETPFSYMDVAEGAKQLLAYGVAADEVNGTLKDLGDIAAGMGRNLNELIFLYGTTIRQQHMYTVDLRQFLGRGIPIGEYLAAQLGIAEDKLQEFVRAGKVTSEVFDTAIRNMANTKFANLMEKQSETITGRIEKIKDTIEIALAEIGKANEDLINGTLDAISVAVAHYREIGTALATAAAAYGTYKAAVMACIAIEKAGTAIRIAYIAAARTFAAAHVYCTRSTVMLTAAQNALNKVLMKNPYMIIGAAVAALAASIAYFATRESEASKVVREKTAALREQQTALENQKEAVNNLIGVITNETAAEGDRYAAYLELHRLYGDIFKDYQNEAYYLTHLSEIKKKIAQDDAENNVNIIQTAINANNADIAKVKAEIARVDENVHPGEGGSSVATYGLQEQLQGLLQVSTSLQAQLKNAQVLLDATKVDSKSTAELQRMAKELTNGKTTIETKNTLDNTKKMLGQKIGKRSHLVRLSNGAVLNKEQVSTLLTAVNAELGDRAERTKTLNSERKSVRSAMDKERRQMKDAEANGDKAGSLKKYQDAAANLAKLQKEYENLFDSKEKQQTAAAKKKYNEMISAEQKFINAKKELLKLQEELAQKELELENQTEQARIDQMDDGTKKSIRQAELNAKKERAALEKEWEEYRKQIAEERFNKEQVEATKTNKGGKKTVKKNFEVEWFDEMQKEKKGEKSKYSDITIDSSTQFGEYYKERQKAIEKERKDAYKPELEAMRDYLKKYGTYQQKRLAITEEYAEKIKKAQESGNKADELTATMERDKAFQNLEMSAVEQKIDWQGVFGNLTGMLDGQLKELLAELKAYTKTDKFKQSDAEDKKVIYDAIENLRNNTPGGSGTLDFSSITQKMNELGAAVNRVQIAESAQALAYSNLKAAQDKYKLAMDSGTDEQKKAAEEQLAIAQSVADNADTAYKNAASEMEQIGQDLRETTSDTVSGLNSVADGLSGFSSGTLQGSFQGIQSMLTGLSKLNIGGKVGDAISKLSETLSSAGTIGQIVSAVLGILDILKDGVGSLVSNLIDLIFNAVNGIISENISGKTLWKIGSSLVNGVSSLANTITFGGFNSWFGEKESDPELEDDIKELTEQNENLADAIGRLTDVMEDASYLKSQEIYEQQEVALTQSEKNTQEEMYRSVNAWKDGGWFHSDKDSSGKKIRQGISQSEWQQVADVLGDSSFMDLSDGDKVKKFFSLTSEEMYKVSTDAAAVYEHIKELANDGYKDAAQYMDTYISYYTQAEELADSLKEKLTNISFDSAKSEMESLLQDLDSSFSDAADDIEGYLRNAIVSALMSDKYSALLEDWYQNFSDAMSDSTLTSDEAENLKQQYLSIYGSMRDEVNAALETVGLDSVASGQSASYGESSSITQDQASELLGRATATQWAVEQQTAIDTQINTNVASLVTLQTANNSFLSEVRNLTILSNGYLEDIAKYNKQMYNEWTTKLDKMQKSLEKL